MERGTRFIGGFRSVIETRFKINYFDLGPLIQ